MSNVDLIYKIAVTQIPKVGDIIARRLIAYCGGPEAVLKEPKKNLAKIPGIGQYIISNFNSKDALLKAEKEIDFIEKHQIRTYFYLDKNYPVRLAQCEDSPILFYSKGEFDFNAPKIVSIVGTRNATQEGKNNCEQLVKYLAEKHKDLLIVSGLAYGIDACAHKSALKYGLQTIGVLGHGFAYLYPAQHKRLAAEMLQKGGLLTDFVHTYRPDGNNFIKRNRIIAGIADATIVVESAETGGALITADIANSYSRDVFAFPGRVNDKFSQGCNKLIKNNRAALIEYARDVEYIMGWEEKENKVVQQTLFTEELPEDENNIISLLKKKGKISVDVISNELKQPISGISVTLLNLEIKGLVRGLPGKIYQLI